MKKIYITLLILISAATITKAQYVTIPDSNFVKFLQTDYPSCMSGNQLDTTCTAVVNAQAVYATGWDIRDLTGIQYFKNVVTLFCGDNLLATLPPLPSTLEELYCEGNQLTVLPALPAGLGELYCHTNHLTSLPALPATLYELHCYYNELTTLPTLPSGLTKLICYDNQLTSLPALPASLLKLQCNHNQLTTLPALPGSLTDLVCDENQLTALPNLPGTLSYLDCSRNNIGTIPALPSQLHLFSCEGNGLTSLPALPNSLIKMGCWNNQITTLPTLPASLVELYCGYNLLSGLPALPTSLEKFYCNHNVITRLPALPGGLTHMECSANQLTFLSPLPASVEHLACDSNQIALLPTLPAQLKYLNCNFNATLTCFPKLPLTMTELDYIFTGITCLPNRPIAGFSTPDVNFMPLCGIQSTCHLYLNLVGNVYQDIDANCQLTAVDSGLGNIPVYLYNGQQKLIQQTFTAATGEYYFEVYTNDTYTIKIDTAQVPFSSVCPAGISLSRVITPIDTFFTGIDFALACQPNSDLAVTDGTVESGAFRPGDRALVQVHAGEVSSNYGAVCTFHRGGQLTVTLHGPAKYDGYAGTGLAPSSSTSKVITWTIADWALVDFKTAFLFWVVVDTSATQNNEVCIDMEISSVPQDADLSNNSLSMCFTISNSFDPNDKWVSPGAAIEPGYSDYLYYTINFQNTGNDSAINIEIVDTISANLDLATLEVTSFSHPTIAQVFNDRRVVQFNFPDIYLPDSNVNEPASHGYVKYKIKPLPNLPLGAKISNTAYIYFDYNAPVVTNTTNTVVQLATAVVNHSGGEGIVLYPNPASEQLTVISEHLSVSSVIVITDMLGRTLLSQQVAGNPQLINVAELPQGVYFITLHSVNGSCTKKFIKE